MPVVSEMPECPLCFGRLLPLSVCHSCSTVSARDGLKEVAAQITCEDCGASNPAHFVCSACNARFPFADIVKPEGPTCPACKLPVPPRAEQCPNCNAVLPIAGAARGRLKRRILGEYGAEDVREVSRIPNLGLQRAEVLCKAGYNRLWKIQRASEADIAAVEGIDAENAARIREALRFLLVIGQQKTKDDVLSEEFECPLCDTVTSLFATRCHDCGAAFDAEELQEEFRKEVEREEEKGLLAYYDVRLLENPDDLELLYARAVLLLAMGHPSETLSALDAMLQLAPGNRRALQAKARALAVAKGLGAASQVLRQTLESLPSVAAPSSGESVVRGKEAAKVEGAVERLAEGEAEEKAAEEAFASLGSLNEITECPECGEPQQPGAVVCPTCGHRFVAEEAVGLPSQRGPETFEEEQLLDDLQRAIAGEEKVPPPPLEPEVSKTVITGKRVMLAFLSKIPGVSKRAADAVSGFFQDIEQIALADVIDIVDIPGVAPAEARLIKVAVVRFLAPAKPATSPKREPPMEIEAPAQPEIAPRGAPPKPVPRSTGAPAPRPAGFEVRRGMVNGRGHVNGRGRVNGIINGTGFVNGVSVAQLQLPRRNLMPRYVAIGLSLLMLFSFAAAYVLPGEPVTGIRIDGDFSDWSGVPMYGGGTVSGNPGVNIVGTWADVEGSRLSLRVQVQENIFADLTDWETMYAFLDVDGNDATGYDLGDMGADYVVRVSGFKPDPARAPVVEDARLLRYDDTGRTRDDWAGFTTVAWPEAAAGWSNGDPVDVISGLEVSVSTDALEGYSEDAMHVRFALDDNAGQTSRTPAPVGTNVGGLLVDQAPQTTTLSGGPQPFLVLTFTALGGVRLTVTQVQLVMRGGAAFSPNPIPQFVVSDQPVTRTIVVDATGLPAGTLVTGIVTDVQVVAAELAGRPPSPFAIVGVEARAYVSQPPPGKVIDGLFADWPAPMPDSDSTPVQRRSLNILSRDGNVAGNRMSLYARFGGDALEGGLTPERPARPRPSGPGGGPSAAPGTPPPPLVGQDYVRFFVDTDAGMPGGFEIGGVFADRLLEVRGRGGRVMDASVYSLVGSNWVRQGSLDWGLGGDEIEVGATLVTSAFNGTQFVAVTADWAGVADRTDLTATRTRGDPGLVPLDGTNFLTAIAKPLTNTPTVDGNCGSSGSEYDGSDTYSNVDVKFFLGRRSETQFVYVCLEVTSDGSDSTADWGELLFDQEHQDSSTPQDNDRRFRRTRVGVFTQEKGDGSVWISCGASCDGGNTAADAFNNSRETYEFKIRFSDIWGDISPQPNERAGFAIMAHNDGVADYTWGSDTVNQDNPGTWGRLDIPEFPSVFIVSVLAVIGLIVLRRKR